MVTPELKRTQRYIWVLVPQIRGLVTTSKPVPMHDDMDLVGSVMNEMLRNGTLGKVQVGAKRKWVNNKQGQSGNNTYRKPASAIKNYAATVPERAPYAGNYPKYNKCNYHHQGECPVFIKCKKIGHLAKNCREGTDGKHSCYECRDPNHMRYDCPKRQGNRNNNGGNNGNPACGRQLRLEQRTPAKTRMWLRVLLFSKIIMPRYYLILVPINLAYLPNLPL
jgi:hypothetical protein